MSDLVFAAFQALASASGRGYRREVALVAKAIRESGDEKALALFGASREPEPDPVFDRDASARVRDVAERAGVDGLVALDLYTEVVNPGWTPFPGCRTVRDA